MGGWHGDDKEVQWGLPLLLVLPSPLLSKERWTRGRGVVGARYGSPWATMARMMVRLDGSTGGLRGFASDHFCVWFSWFLGKGKYAGVCVLGHMGSCWIQIWTLTNVLDFVFAWNVMYVLDLFSRVLWCESQEVWNLKHRLDPSSHSFFFPC